MTLVNRLLLTTVVYSSRPGHAVDVERAFPVAAPEAEVGVEPGGLDEDGEAVTHEQFLVAGGADVLHERVRDVGVDVHLGGTGGVVRRGLLTVDGAPGEEGPARWLISAARSRAAGSIRLRKSMRFRASSGGCR